MSALDFLFQGQAPQQTTSYGQTASSVPTWLQDYTQGLLAQSAAIASQPYQTYGGPRIAGFTPYQQTAQQQVSDLQGGYKSALDQAQTLATGAANPAAIGQAQQTVQSAINPTAAQINPYVQNVIDRGSQLAQRTFNEKIMPEITAKYTANGNYGSAAAQRESNMAARDLTEGLNAQNQSALAQAYTNAQQTGLAAGQELGGLGYEQGVLGLQGASALGNLGQLGQTLGLQGASALDTIGQEQQQQNQQNLNLGYQDFLNQQQWPYQQASWLSQMLTGTATPQTTPTVSTTSRTGYAPAYGASPLSQAIGIYQGLNPSSNGSARGGRTTRLRSGLDSLRRAA